MKPNKENRVDQERYKIMGNNGLLLFCLFGNFGQWS